MTRILLLLYLKQWHNRSFKQQGFALPLAMGLGFVMLIIGMSTIMVAQSDRSTAFQRRETGASFAVTEGGIARVLAQLTQKNNAVLLTRNYDTLNPKTNQTYLGIDGVPNSGDEENSLVNEWSTYSATASACMPAPSAPPSITYTDTSTTGTYTLKAYRYNPDKQTGTLLVEGKQGAYVSYVAVTISIRSDLVDFPGVLVSDRLALRGRRISGRYGNAYYDPNLSGDNRFTASAAQGDSARPDYRNALWSGSLDGFNNDLVDGKIIACSMSPMLRLTPPPGASVTNLGELKGNLSLSGVSNTRYYRVKKVKLKNTDTVTVDTTNGPVYIYVTEDEFEMEGSSRIINIRQDGKPPQAGDLRIFMVAEWEINLYDTACIQNAFIYNPESDLHLQTSGGGCASGNSVDGVVWVEDIINTKNSPTARTIPDEEYELTRTPVGVTAGIRVPDDLSSLADLSAAIGVPT
ncbi:MAG: hypothetical protein WA902_19765, partial [Thermosynechococcaceae cyanobacterium]